MSLMQFLNFQMIYPLEKRMHELWKYLRNENLYGILLCFKMLIYIDSA